MILQRTPIDKNTLRIDFDFQKRIKAVISFIACRQFYLNGLFGIRHGETVRPRLLLILCLLRRTPLLKQRIEPSTVYQLLCRPVIDLDIISAITERINQILPRTTPHRLLTKLLQCRTLFLCITAKSKVHTQALGLEIFFKPIL